MIIVPYYDLLALPDVTCYLQAEQLKNMAAETAQTDGESEVLFLMMREQKEIKELTAEDFYRQ